MWIQRYHPRTGTLQSYNPKTKQFSEDLNKSHTAFAKRTSFATFQFLKGPLQYLFGNSSEDSDEIKLQKYENGKLKKASEISSYQGMIDIIDVLLRYKYLHDEGGLGLSDYELQFERTILKEKATQLGIKSLDELYSCAELLVVMKRRLRSSESPTERKTLQKHLSEIKHRMRDSYPESNEVCYSMHILSV